MIGQCNKEGKKRGYKASQRPPHHIWLQYKRLHSFENTIRRSLQKSTDHITKNLKTKKQSIEAIAEVSISTTRKTPFREVPHFIKKGQMGAKI